MSFAADSFKNVADIVFFLFLCNHAEASYRLKGIVLGNTDVSTFGWFGSKLS